MPHACRRHDAPLWLAGASGGVHEVEHLGRRPRWRRRRERGADRRARRLEGASVDRLGEGHADHARARVDAHDRRRCAAAEDGWRERGDSRRVGVAHDRRRADLDEDVRRARVRPLGAQRRERRARLEGRELRERQRRRAAEDEADAHRRVVSDRGELGRGDRGGAEDGRTAKRGVVIREQWDGSDAKLRDARGAQVVRVCMRL